MQWTDARNAGFCPDDVTPWLPVDDNRLTRNVESESDDPASLLEWYRSLLALRSASPALHQGSLELLPADSESLVVYERVDGEQRFLVAANLGDDPVVATIDAAFATLVLASAESVELQVARRDGDSGHVLLPAHTAAILSV